MNVTIRCPRPECNRKLFVPPEALRKKLRCPVCSHVFRLPPSEVPPTPVGGPTPPPVPVPSPGRARPAPGDESDNDEIFETLADVPVRDIPELLSPGGAMSGSRFPRVAPANKQPQQIGRFSLRKRLGEGVFGTVWKAYDPRLDREVALKVAKPGLLDTPKRIEQFFREARAAAQFKHPNIVTLYEAGRDGETFYFAAAYIRGQTLGDALRDGIIDPRAAADITRKLADALHYAHQRGVVHRDVKPGNVMLDEFREPQLLDFGVASRQAELVSEASGGTIPGTPEYVAPEQAGAAPGVSFASADQYSLGCVLYELLTGQTPFDGPPQTQLFKHLKEEPAALRTIKPLLSKDLEAICLKCLRKEPGQRYPDCAALAEDLRRYLDGLPIQARVPTLVERLSRWTQREPVMAIVLAFTAAALVGALAALAMLTR
jgi:serine/threonine protein kinase